MSKKLRFVVLGILLFVVATSTVFIINKNLRHKSSDNDLININDLSEEFMENYLKEIKEIKQEDKENILIVTSKKKLKDIYGATKVIEGPDHQYFLQYKSAEDKEQALKKFNSNDNSSFKVSENIIYEVSGDTVLVSNYNSWGIEAMGIDTLLENISNYNLNDITVAIIDTGLDIELFNQNFPGRLAGSYNVLTSNEEMTDINGHGTHIAGTIAEATPNNVKILPVKVSETKKMYNSDIIAGIDYVTYNKKADIMNMSFSSYYDSYASYNSIKSANQNNIVSVVAAGNDNTSVNSYPAAFDNTISIAAVNSDKDKADFSNYGNYIMFSSPGVDILSINGTMSGTSMATPHAVSSIALLKSLNNNITFKDIVTILRRYSDDLGNASWDEYYGFGFINFETAEICDGTDCDEFNIFKKNNLDNLEEIVEGYEITPILSNYNYGTINNILGTKVKVNYANGKSILYNLYDFPNLEISGYNPKIYSMDYQTVSVKFTTPLGLEIDDSFKIRQIQERKSVWEYNKIDDNNIELTEFKDADFAGNTLYITSEIDGYNVVAIADGEQSIFQNTWNAFRNVYNLFLPTTLTKIGNNAFYKENDSNALGYVKSETENLEIGNNAFRGSGALTTIDANISKVGDYAFYNNVNLMNIKFSDNMTHIGASAFESGLKNANITIPKNVMEIGNKAFLNSGIKEITFLNKMDKISDNMFLDNHYLGKVVLPKNLKEIGESAFAECTLKEIMLPDTLIKIGNAAFKNAFDAKAQISLIIPKNVSEIGTEVFMNNYDNKGLKEIIFLNKLEVIPARAFFNHDALEKIILPESIKEIGESAFAASENLKEIYLGKNVTIINDNTFYNISPEAKFYVYNNTYSKTFVSSNNYNYTQIDPDIITVKNSKTEYSAFDKADLDNISIELTYNEKVIRTETINQNIEVEYESSEDSFRYGDTYYKIIGYNNLNYKIENNVEVTISKAIPKYEIPTNLTAEVGQKLSDVVLPAHFEWMNGNILLENNGHQSFIAKYVPADTTNYEIVENININVAVGICKTILTPIISVDDKIYDGTKTIDVKSISITGLEINDYTLVSAESSSENAGKTTAKIILRLSDEKFKDYSFEDGSQQKEFNSTFNIFPQKLTIPTLLDKTYEYTGQMQTVELNNFDSSKMNITNNTRTEVGSQNVTITLKNSNYVWVDNTSREIILLFTILEKEEYDFKINKYSYDKINKYIDLIEVNTTVDVFKSNIILNKNYTMDVEYKKLNNKNVLYTGGKTKIFKSQIPYIELTNIVRGDVNGNGVIDIIDYIRIKKDIMDTEKLKNEYKKAADMNNNNSIDIIDYIRIKKIIMEEN